MYPYPSREVYERGENMNSVGVANRSRAQWGLPWLGALEEVIQIKNT